MFTFRVADGKTLWHLTLIQLSKSLFLCPTQSLAHVELALSASNGNTLVRAEPRRLPQSQLKGMARAYSSWTPSRLQKISVITGGQATQDLRLILAEYLSLKRRKPND